MPRRSLYIWKLEPLINAEGSARLMIQKAKRAKVGALWVKIANGEGHDPNVTGSCAAKTADLVSRAQDEGIKIWGWHVPRCATEGAVPNEIATVRQITHQYSLDGLIMDAEGGPAFFLGSVSEAQAYGREMRLLADEINIPLGLSSNDIPQNLTGWLPKFDAISSFATINFPQVYYGSSQSVLSRLERAIAANAHLNIPFSPVGAGWVGDAGGCASASACAERAREFIRLVKEKGFPEYSFWRWGGMPAALWEVLNTTPA